jgi:hypothetical protein
MNIIIGDNVRFLNEVGGGIVTSILNKESVLVLTEDGFEIPSLITQLVVIRDENTKIEPYNKPVEIIEKENEIISSYNYIEREDIFFSENNTLPEEKDEINIYFALVPVNNSNITDCNLDAYIINDSDFEVLYNLCSKKDELFVNIDSGSIEPDTKVFISHFKRENISEISTLLFQLIFFKTGIYEPLDPFSKIIKINPAKFFKESNYEENLYFENKAVIFSVFKDDLKREIEKLTVEEIKDIIKEKEISPPALNILSQNFKKSKEIHFAEVDLHIPQLVDDYKNLSNSEIVDIQMNHFHKELESAIACRTSKVVFIHGVGSGTLKTEIRRSLDKDYPNLKYQDASFKEYGYGATLVIIRS